MTTYYKFDGSLYRVTSYSAYTNHIEIFYDGSWVDSVNAVSIIIISGEILTEEEAFLEMV